MRQIVKYNPAGHVISVCIFDPAGLPSDFDRRVQGDEQLDHVSELISQGRFIWQTPGEIDFLIHVYVDEDPPEWMAPPGEEFDSGSDLHVPSGVIRVCSLEDLAEASKAGHPASSLQDADKACPGGTIELPRGRYHVTYWETGWPTKEVDRIMREKFGFRGWGRRKKLGAVTVYLFVGLLVLAPLLIILAGKGKVSWPLWGVYTALWATWAGMLNVMTRIDRNPAKKAAELEFPPVVVKLKSLPE